MLEHEYWSLKDELEQALRDGDHIEGCSASGRCDDAVECAMEDPKVAAILERLEGNSDKLVADLAEYGAWDADDLADHEANLARLVWTVACDVRENDRESRQDKARKALG